MKVVVEITREFEVDEAAMKRCACGYLPLPDATHCPKCGRPIESAAQDRDCCWIGDPCPVHNPSASDPSASRRRDILDARDALRRIQTGRVWFEPHSDCLNPIIAAIKALDRLAGYDNVGRAGRV